jgi:hypothetical protein
MRSSPALLFFAVGNLKQNIGVAGFILPAPTHEIPAHEFLRFEKPDGVIQ